MIFISTFLVMVGILSESYYNDYNFVEKLSWIADDPPWMPIPNLIGEIKPFWGVHYFGDLLIWFGYATHPDPYFSGPPDAQILPLGILIYKMMLSFGLTFGFTSYILLSLVLPYIVFSKFLKDCSLDRKLILYLASVILSAGSIITIDRGGFQLISSSICMLSIYYFYNKENKLGIIYGIIAISLKPYLILPYIIFIFDKKNINLLKLVIFTTSVNLLLFATLPGGIIRNIQSFLLTFIDRVDGVNIPGYAFGNGMSLFGGTEQFLSLIIGNSKVERFFLNHSALIYLISIIWIAIVIKIFRSKNINIYMKLFFAFSTIQMVSPGVGKYGSHWIFIAIIFLQLISEKIALDNSKLINISVVILILNLVVSVIPYTLYFTSADSISFGSRLMLSPLVLFVSAIILIYFDYERKINKERKYAITI
jgi:hypothetical protein